MISKHTNNKGVDVVIDFSGNKYAVEEAVDYVKPGGGISILGVFNDKLNVDVNKIVFKGLHLSLIHISCATYDFNPRARKERDCP